MHTYQHQIGIPINLQWKIGIPYIDEMTHFFLMLEPAIIVFYLLHFDLTGLKQVSIFRRNLQEHFGTL